MKHDLTTGTWQDDTGCPISFVLAATSDDDRQARHRLLQRLALVRHAIIRLAFPPIPWPMTGIGKSVRNDACSSGGIRSSSNPCRRRGWRIRHHGGGVCKVICAFCVVSDL